jgi:hypothetical protein
LICTAYPPKIAGEHSVNNDIPPMKSVGGEFSGRNYSQKIWRQMAVVNKLLPSFLKKTFNA